PGPRRGGRRRPVRGNQLRDRRADSGASARLGRARHQRQLVVRHGLRTVPLVSAATHSRTNVNYGYLLGAGLIICPGLVVAFLAVAAERKSLEDVARPLTVARARAQGSRVAPARAN